jgi:hypothetical protein
MAHDPSDPWQLKTGAAVLATCLVQTLNESDPSFRDRFLQKLEIASDRVQERHPTREMRDVREMLSWTRELITGFNLATGQGDPLLR